MRTLRPWAALSLFLVVACNRSSEAPPAADPRGAVWFSAAVTVPAESVTVEVQPANLTFPLELQSPNTFRGTLTVPLGAQTFTARAYVGAAVVGVGSVVVNVVPGENPAVFLRIYDTTGPAPTPDHGPIITSIVVPSTVLTANEPITFTSTAYDPDGDPLAFAWTASCTAGAFGTPDAPATSFVATEAAECDITLVVSAAGLTDRVLFHVTVKAVTTGTVPITVEFVPNPRVSLVTLLNSTGNAFCRAGKDPSSTSASCAGTLHPLQAITVRVEFQPAEAAATLENDCQGTAVPVTSLPGVAEFTWTAPAGAADCLLEPRLALDTLSDALPIAIAVGACADDAYEPNDAFDHPAQIEPAGTAPSTTTIASLSGNDDDWFSIEAGAYTESVQVTLATAASLPIEVFDAAGTYVGSGLNQLTFPVAAGAFYRLHVFPGSAPPACAASYDLTISRVAALRCGDGIISMGEACDDGGTVGGDGCSSACTLEPGWTCSGEPTACTMLPTSVAAASPANGAVNVAPWTPIAIVFDGGPVDPSTLVAQTAVGPCTGTVQVSPNDFVSCMGFASSSPTLAGATATFTPSPWLDLGSRVTIRVTDGVHNAAGAAIPPYVTPDGFTVAVQSDSSRQVVISQVYGGGGNTGALFQNDFVELHNRGTATVSLEGMSVQYAGATTTTWQVTPLTGSIAPGGFFLVRESAGSLGAGLPLPTPDAAGVIMMGNSAGKVALVGTTTAITSCDSSSILDLVGYGSTASCSEGSPAGAPSNTTSVARIAGGCWDTNANSIDFTVGAPSPRNSASPALPCGVTVNETGSGLEIAACRVSFPSTLDLAPGQSSLVYSRAFHPLITNDPGNEAALTVEVGFGPTTANPESQTGWTWSAADFNLAPLPEYEYVGSVVAPAEPGTYGYTFRFSLDSGASWTYCDLDNAGSISPFAFQSWQLPLLTVAAP